MGTNIKLERFLYQEKLLKTLVFIINYWSVGDGIIVYGFRLKPKKKSKENENVSVTNNVVVGDSVQESKKELHPSSLKVFPALEGIGAAGAVALIFGMNAVISFAMAPRVRPA